jgi:two-component system sensor histidine kinase YesM
MKIFQRMKSSIFYKMLISFLVISIIPLLIVVITFYGFSSKLLERTVVDHTYSSILKSSENLDVLIEEYSNFIDVLSKDESVLRVLSQKDSGEDKYDEVYQKIYLFLTGKKIRLPVYLIDREGNSIIYISNYPYQHRFDCKNWGMIRKMENSPNNEVLYSEKILNTSGSVVSMSIGRAIKQKENVIGYIVVDIPRSILEELMKSNIDGMPYDLILIDKYDYIILNLKNPMQEGVFLDNETKKVVEKPNKKINIFNIKKPMLITCKNDKYDLTFLAYVPVNIIAENYNFTKKLLIWSFTISLILCFVISYILVKNMVAPVDVLVNSMEKVKNGDFSTRVNLKRNDEFGILGERYNDMVCQLKSYMEMAKEKQERIRTAEIKVLESQINPHFLYNTLDTIKWIAKLNNVKEIVTISTDLGKLLRNSINNKKEFVTVKESIEVIECYLNIQRIRYEDKLEVSIDICDDILNCVIPKLILQPIVENSIVHGIEGKGGIGQISVSGIRDGTELIFTIKDDGVGMPLEKAEQLLKESDGEHVGLYNVERRIKLYYGENYGLKIKSSENVGTEIIMRIPDNVRGENL